MATYLDPTQQKKPATGTSTAFPQPTGMPNPLGTSTAFPQPTGMPNPLGTSAPGPTVTEPNPLGTAFPPPTGMPNPLGTSAPGPTANTTLLAPPSTPFPPQPGMPNPLGTSAPGPTVTEPNPLGTSAPGPTVADPNPMGAPGPTANLPPGASYLPGHSASDPNALVQLPSGQILPQSHPDLQRLMGGAPGGAPAAPGAPAGPGGLPTSQRDVLTGTATPGTNTQGQPTTVASAFQQALINRLVPQDISSQNPAIKGSIAANRNAESRGLSRTQELLAERAAATGQSGAQESNLARAAGESAGRQGAFEGNALFGLHQQQAADLRDAMALGGNLLSDQQRQELQRYGIDLDAALRREGLDVQRTLGGTELDIRRQLGLGQLDLGRRGLDQNESQFGRSLGANLGIEQARLNQQALLSLLAGL